MSRSADLLANARRASAMPGSPYDLFVRRAKKILPVVAGLGLAITFIWPLSASQEFSFILDKNSVETSPERLRLEGPVYRGQDRKGQAFEISAATAVQKSSETPVVELTDIRAQLAMKEGAANVRAPVGRYDLERERLSVPGPVRFWRTDGYSLDTRNVFVDLPQRMLVSEGGVSGRMPLGSFAAGRLTGDVAGRRLILDKGASLHITQRQGIKGR